jgi:N-alpha-acetyltransferase 30
MVAEGVEEVVLECETSNAAAQRLYRSLGFLRDKQLRRYYFTGTDAFRLKLRVK